jgi:hypothetical protein
MPTEWRTATRGYDDGGDEARSGSRLTTPRNAAYNCGTGGGEMECEHVDFRLGGQ